MPKQKALSLRYASHMFYNNICLLIQIDKYAVRLHDTVATNDNKLNRSQF